MNFVKLIESYTGSDTERRLAEPTSRRGAFSRIGDAFGDVAKVALPLGAAILAPRTSYAQTGSDPIAVFNFALLLEYLEAEFYISGLDSAGLLTGDTRAVVEQISQHESAHVEFLRGAISGNGGTPIDRPTFDFTAGGTFADVFSNPATFLAVAQAFEDTGVRAYKGQAPNLVGTGDLLTAALQIHSVEARHASEIRRIRGLDGWIPFADGIDGVPATDAVYAGENNLTQLGLNAADVGGVTPEEATEAYDEPLSRDAVTEIASLFIV